MWDILCADDMVLLEESKKEVEVKTEVAQSSGKAKNANK